MDMQHGHSAWKYSMLMLDMQQGQAALHFKDMQHRRAEERKMQKDVEMQR
jgi:hypothetical protein